MDQCCSHLWDTFSFPILGLTAGDGFGLWAVEDSNQPYCWGSSSYRNGGSSAMIKGARSSSYIEMGVPQPMIKGAEYEEISAGDYHLCGLRKPLTGKHRNYAFVDCWGYNMTKNYVFEGQIKSLSAGSEFNCGLFSSNMTVLCWGDETSSRVISLIPREMRFQKVAAGGYHVCGISEGLNSGVFCWGRSLNLEEELSVPVAYSRQGNVDLPPKDPMLTVVGGKFHACGIKSYDHQVVCWGFIVKPSTPPPKGVKVYGIAAGNYFTCGVMAKKSFLPVCWGVGFPISLPLAVSPGLCKETPCSPGSYEVNPKNAPCKSPNFHVCMPCSIGCPAEMYQKWGCTLKSDRVCDYNCSSCNSVECFSNCSSSSNSNAANGSRNERFWLLQLPIIIAEITFAVLLVIIMSLTAVLYVRYRLQSCHCKSKEPGFKKANEIASCRKENVKVRPDFDELKIRRAQMFNYEELERATGGFKEESVINRRIPKEFHTELDLLSRLNHTHLLNLLGYCEEGGERLLVYEFMAHGSLHQHLHGKNKALKEQLDWVRRVTIVVQAARGIEYLHGYACPPVIHRDIKSSNILIDEEHNARVADFGLSLLGPANSSSPLAELPAGTLGYLDPEYYRLHYLTTKSDVYSFGVLLLEILSGRKAIDMQYEEGNIVEWAVPLIKSGDIFAVLDPVLKPPADIEALKRIANVASKCVRMRGKARPSMDKVTTALERALAQLMGSPCSEQPILPTEVILGSNRMHKKSSQRSSNRSVSETEVAEEVEDPRFEFRAPSWITFPSVTSSQRRKSSVSEADVEGKNIEGRNTGNVGYAGDGLRSLEEEIGPASPQQSLFLQHNF
ncbi:putative receptor protein kinase CRINKLY4 [Hibiscus syriacus]|uniref:non-specific serine/threonine protein kinase n=1 Tax=Hibiscus syriacus TaxID=106335 RepID=A0A6A3BR30_HIBSY|nr:putative receptor protein kinase CRINKLY4 [Hibiscus syriacus]